MERIEKTTSWNVLNLFFFLLVVSVNALANILPINGVGTGEVSDYYGNLFAPAAITFSIWGLIYLLLAFFIIYQLGIIKKNRPSVIQTISPWFILSCAANAVWIYAWHHYMIVLTVLLMLVILLSLSKIFWTLYRKEMSMTATETWALKIPFAVYFGWITVATIANVTALLISVDWGGFGISESVWTVIIVLIGAVIGSFVTWKAKSAAYALVIIWAYTGILIKHNTSNGFSGMYQSVTIATAVGIALVIISIILAKRRKNP